MTGHRHNEAKAFPNSTTGLPPSGMPEGPTDRLRDPSGDLSGVVDLHVHASPDVVPRRMDDVAVARAARDAGMRALVLKSHHFGTTDRAWMASRMVGGAFEVLGGLVLNTTSCGGLNPDAVWANLTLGARVIWLPTLSAANHFHYILRDDAERNVVGITQHQRPISVLDDEGRVHPELEEILAMVAESDAVLASGHLAPAEIVTVFRRARELGVERLLVTHAEAPMTKMGVPVQKELTQLGAYIEHCYLSLVMGLDPGEMVQSVRSVGVERSVFSTDLGQAANPDPTDGLRHFREAVCAAGFDVDEWRRVTSDNPTELLGLCSKSPVGQTAEQ